MASLGCHSVDWLAEGAAGAAGQPVATAGSGGSGGSLPPDPSQGGSSGSDGVGGDAGSGGTSGTGGTTAGGGGTGGSSSTVQCPPDDGTAAALLLAGIDPGNPDAGADAGGPFVTLPELVGWAAEPGLGTETTVGGAAGQIVDAQSAAELIDFASRAEPLVIRVCGHFLAQEVRVASNKTLLGVGANAGITGGILIGGEAEYSSNVVIKNLSVNARTSEVLGEAIRVDRTHHVWIDHCALSDATGDAALDIVNGSDFVTVSWTKFHFTPGTPDPEHRFACRVGDHNQDPELSDAQDTDHLNVTLHHDWFADDVRQRAPRLRHGKVHIYNTYWSLGPQGNDYSIWASTKSRVLLENNHFDGVSNPHDVTSDDAELVASGNIYEGTTGTASASGSAFVPPYAYTPDAAASVRQQVRAGAGPH